MTRAERRRQAKMQEKCQVPLNLNLTVAQVAGMTGQQASILQTYLKRMEQQKTEAVTDAVIREAQEKLERAEDYITITNIAPGVRLKIMWQKIQKSFIQSTISLRYITIIRKNTVMDIIKAWLKPMVSTDEPQQCITA